MEKLKKATACFLLLCLVLSAVLLVPSVSAEGIPPYDYSSFIGTWYSANNVTLEIIDVNEETITFYIPALFPAAYAYPVVNNQVTWTSHSARVDFYESLTFYDDSIHYVSTPSSGTNVHEYWFTSETIKPRRIETGNYPVILNGKQLEFDQPPVMCGDRILVPLRKVCEEMGAEVYYDLMTAYEAGARPGDNINIIDINIIKNYAECVSFAKLPYENNWILQTVDLRDSRRHNIDLDVQPITINDRILVPVRALSEALGGEVLWNEETQTVTINCPAAASRRSVEEIEQIQQFSFEDALAFVKQQYFVPESGYDSSIQGEYAVPVEHADNFEFDEKGKKYGFYLYNNNQLYGVLDVYQDGTITQRRY